MLKFFIFEAFSCCFPAVFLSRAMTHFHCFIPNAPSILLDNSLVQTQLLCCLLIMHLNRSLIQHYNNNTFMNQCHPIVNPSLTISALPNRFLSDVVLLLHLSICDEYGDEWLHLIENVFFQSSSLNSFGYFFHFVLSTFPIKIDMHGLLKQNFNNKRHKDVQITEKGVKF